MCGKTIKSNAMNRRKAGRGWGGPWNADINRALRCTFSHRWVWLIHSGKIAKITAVTDDLPLSDDGTKTKTPFRKCFVHMRLPSIVLGSGPTKIWPGQLPPPPSPGLWWFEWKEFPNDGVDRHCSKGTLRLRYCPLRAEKWPVSLHPSSPYAVWKYETGGAWNVPFALAGET